jgi:hypothetical protein
MAAVLVQSCEPSLAALVIRGDTNEPGYVWIGGAAAEQTRCFEHWAP